MLLALASVFLPLIAAIIAGFGGRALGNRGANAVTCSAMVLAAAASVFLFNDVVMGGQVVTYPLGEWISVGALKANWSLRLDTLSVLMILVVNLISAAVHIYSIGYMAEDRGIPRFMSFLSLFTFFMLMLVTADDLLQLFFGWEGVGLASYLLIGFWFHKPSAAAASIKAFLVNRVGDFGFSLGIFACYMATGSVQFDALFKAAPTLATAVFNFHGFYLPALTTICLLLFVGAVGKSAQLGLHTWLPDAMEGPTPVSALIHAATMVTAGVFMLARFSPLFEYAPTASAVVTIIGALTAIMAAMIALTQNDIKRVIAYSTMSQLGFMFFALGVSAYGAAMFHLTTHAFFKALLFLGSGAVIHALAGEQDMRKMGGLRHETPITYMMMWIGALALAGIGIDGVFGFAGFYSKDSILASALVSGSSFAQTAYALGIIAAFMTAFYSARLIFMTFHGDKKTETHAHEAPMVMLAPLVFLAVGAVFAGFEFEEQFVGAGSAAFWRQALFVKPEHNNAEVAHHLSFLIKSIPVLVALMGGGLAWLFYCKRPDLPARFVATMGRAYALIANKFYVDEAYDFLFVRPAKAIGRFCWCVGDDKIIDGCGPHGLASLMQKMGQRVCTCQSGCIYHYALAMVVGLVLFVTWFWIGGSL